MKTKITQLLGIEHPILMGGLQWICRAEFVAAIAQTGATGFLPAMSFASPEALAQEIRKTKTLTSHPFGVNISMLPSADPEEKALAYVETVVREKVPFVETSGRNPKNLIPALKEAGIKIIHKVTSPRHARKAQDEGADAVVLVGYEGGGHPGMDQVGTFVNLPATVDSVQIPVIAAGGICDGRGLAAAIALGAEGIMMGTRWIATEECPVHDKFKQWIINAKATDTIIIQRSIRNALRAVNNQKAREVLGLEQLGADLQQLLPHISGKRGQQALQTGDMDSAVLTAGQCIGRIQEILTVPELVNKILMEYQQAVQHIAECEA